MKFCQNEYPDHEKLTLSETQNVLKIYSNKYFIEEMKNEFIRVQIFKMTEDAPWGGNEVVRTKDYRLMQDERYYQTNYFTLYEKGRYVMQVFSHSDFQHPLALNDFYVK